MISRTEVHGGTHVLYRLPVGNSLSSTASKELNHLVENTYRQGGENCTIWLDVQTTKIPKYVFETLRSLDGLPAALVLTHAGCSSHGPGKRLPADVLGVVAGLGRDGKIWHPLQNKMVPAMLEE